MTESQELIAKERRDAKRKAESRGIPVYLLRGQVYSCSADKPMRPCSSLEQMLWDALPDLG